MPSTRPLKVFLCHATADKPAVRKLYRYLRSKGMEPWLDAENLLPGENWEVEIPNALFASDVILVCLSKNSVNKEGYVQKEITFALDKALEKPEGTIFVIPAKLEECDVPQRLNRFQWVDMYREDGRRRLMLSLNKRAAQLGPAVEQAVVADELTEKMEREAKEKTERAAAEKLALEKLERENAEKVAREKAAREAKEKAERAAAEKLALEKIERENAEKIAHEKAAREAKEKVERAAVEKLALEKIERENAEKAAREKADREAKEKAERATAEKLALEKTERENAEKVAREKREREAKRKIAREAKPAPVNLRWLGIGGIILFACILGGFGLNYLINLPVATATTFSPAPTKTSEVSQTSEVFPTETPTQTPIPITTLGIGSTEISPKDNMTLLYVPEGEFTMGSDSDTHTVYLDAFWIDQTEVTNKQYAACVSVGACTQPSNTSSYTRSSYYGNSEFDEFPVIYVDWNQTKAYCEWANRRLPTEAEWEKAAGWNDLTQKKYIYPWGNDFNGSIVNFCDKKCTFDWADKNSDDGFADTSPVKNYPDGVSPYGAYDMAGNVWEWVSDWYGDTYYQSSPSSNPLGPDSGDYRVLRGGSWNRYDYFVRSSYRDWVYPTNSDDSFGFRCSRSLP